jgi:hypothetical protein
VKPRVVFALVTSVLLLVFLVTTYRTESTSPDNTKQPPRHYLVALFVAALFPLALLAFAWSQGIDGFAFGSIVLAALLETVLYVGWSASPQEEADWFFFAATGLPFVLIVVTLLFNALQREA